MQYCVIPGALSAAELHAMREAFDHDRRENEDCWGLRGQSRDDGDAHWSSFGGEVVRRNDPLGAALAPPNALRGRP